MNQNENDRGSDGRESLVPSQRLGKAIDAEAYASLSTEKTAVVFYELVKNRMQHVNSWSVIAGKLSAEFQLVNKEGLEVFRKAKAGDYLRLEILGASGTADRGFDWVIVEQLQDEVDSFSFRVRPTSHPSARRLVQDPFVDHESMSTFQVIRAGRRVIVTISDRNTKQKAAGGNAMDRVRRQVFAWAAQARFAQIQWQALADGLVSR